MTTTTKSELVSLRSLAVGDTIDTAEGRATFLGTAPARSGGVVLAAKVETTGRILRVTVRRSMHVTRLLAA